MPDIFDEVLPATRGDVFDQLGAQREAGDIFDAIQEDSGSRPGFVSDMVNRFRRGGATAVGRLGQAIARGGYAIERLAGEDANVAPADRPARLRERSNLYRTGEALVQGAQEAFPTDPARDGGLMGTLAESAGAMVPTILAGAAGRTAAALEYGLTSGEAAAQEATQLGRPELADAAFAATAPIGALTEGALGVPARLLKTLRPAKPDVVRALLRGARNEAAQEGLEQVGQNLVASDVVGYDPDRPAMEGVGMSMLAGGILGGGLSGAAAVVARNLPEPPAPAVTADTPEPDLSEFGGMGEPGPVMTPGSAAQPPIPESRDSIEEQIRLTLDPESTRQATLLTPGADVGEVAVPEGLLAEQTQHGWVLYNPEKTSREEVVTAAQGERFDGRLLGLSNSGATPVTSSTVVTTSVAGVADVATELVPNDATAIDAAMEAQQQSVPGGRTEVRPAEDVAQYRTAEAAPTPQEAPKVDRWDAFLTKAIDSLAMPSGYLYSDPLLIQTLGRPVLRGALVAVRAAYRASKSVVQAVEAGVQWLNQQGVQYDVERFKTWAASHFKDRPEPKAAAGMPVPAGETVPGVQADAATPVPPPVPSNLPERKLSPRLQAADWLTPAVRQAIRNRTYDPTSMLASEAAANQLVIDLGPERAERLVFDLSVEIPMAVRGAMTAAVAQEYSKLERTATKAAEAKAWRDRNSDYLSRLLPMTTSFGQFINMLRAFTWQTADGAVLTARRLLDQATENHLASYRRLLDAARNALRAAHDVAITDTINAPDVQKVGQYVVDDAVVRDDDIRRLIRGRAVEDMGPDIRAEAAEAGHDADRVLAAVNQFWGPNPKAEGLIPLLEAAGVPRSQAATWADAWIRKFTRRVGELEWGVRQTLASERTRAARTRAIASLWGRERADAANALVNALRASKPNTPQRTALQEFATRVARRLRDQVRSKTGKAPGLTDLELLREASVNFDRYQEVWDTAWAQAKEGGLSGIVAKLEAGQPQPFADARMDRAIRDKLRDWNLRLGEAVRRSRQGQTGKLGDSIASAAGLSPGSQAHTRLRDAINARFEKVAAERKRREIERLLRDQPDEGTTAKLKSVFRKFADLHELGALDEAKYFDAIRAGLGLRNLSDADLARLRALATAITAVPPDQQFRRQEATLKLLNELEKFRKPVQWYEWPMAFWYANVLSGPLTQVTNLLANALNLANSLTVQTIRNPAAIVDVGRALGRGVERAIPEAIQALRTGAVTGQRLGEKWGDPGFFQKVDKRWLLPWAMVGRALAAGDLLFFHPASEARQALLARAIARREGKTGQVLRQRTQELLANEPARRSAAAAQASGEGFTGIQHRRRVAEILQAARDAAGDFTQTGREYALATTFNNKPYGVLGAVAEAINAFNAKHPWGRFFVPFTNIIANVVNEGLNYTPLGTARALKASNWGLYGKPQDVMSWADGQTLADLHAKAAIGTALLLGLAWRAAAHMDDDDASFWIHGQGPTDKGKRDTLKANGWIPNSIKLGSRYVSYQQTPLALPLAVIGNTLDALKYGKLSEGDLLTRVAYVGSATLKSVVDQSFLDAIATLSGAVDRPSETKGGENLMRWAARTGTSFVVPNALRQIDRAFDPGVYDEPGARGALLSQLPFARRNLKPVLNGLGEPVSRPLGERFTKQERPDPVWRELARLEVGVYPRAMQYRGRALTDDEIYEVVATAGPRIRQRISRLIAVRNYARWKEETQRDRIADIIERERGQAKARIMRGPRVVSKPVSIAPSEP